MRMRIVVITVLCALAWACVADAQPGPPGRPEGGPGGPRPGMMMRHRMMGPEGLEDWDAKELVEMLMMARLSRDLGLDDEQTVVLVRRFEELKEKTEGLKKEQDEAMEALQKSIQAGAPDEEIDTKLRNVIELEKKLAGLQVGLITSADGLTSTQRAKLYIFMKKFNEDMRKMVQRAQQRRGMALRGMGMNMGGTDAAPGRPQGPPADMPERREHMRQRRQDEQEPDQRGQMMRRREMQMQE